MPESSVRPLSAQRANEARLLALMLRTSRLTWLFAAEGTDKSALLVQGVLPLLQRRRQDRVALSGPRQAPPAGNRERRAAASGRSTNETVIYFERWDEAPLTALKTALIQSLPAERRAGFLPSLRLSKLIGDIEGGAGLNLFFVVNNFERFFGKATSAVERSAFADEWSEAVCSAGLGASFLMSLDESHRSRLDLFSRRVPGLEHNALRLLPETKAPAPQAAASERRPEKTARGAWHDCRRRPQTAARLARLHRDGPGALISHHRRPSRSTRCMPSSSRHLPGPPCERRRRIGRAEPPVNGSGIPDLSLTFAPEDYLSPATRDALAAGAAFDPGIGEVRPGEDPPSHAPTPSTGRRLLSAFKRLGGNGKA